MPRTCLLKSQPDCGSLPSVVSPNSWVLLLGIAPPASNPVLCPWGPVTPQGTYATSCRQPCPEPTYVPSPSTICVLLALCVLLGDKCRQTRFPRPLISLMTLGKFPNPPEPQPPHLRGEDGNNEIIAGLPVKIQWDSITLTLSIVSPQ